MKSAEAAQRSLARRLLELEAGAGPAAEDVAAETRLKGCLNLVLKILL